MGADVQHRCLGTLARETEEGKAAVELQQEAATLMEDVAKVRLPLLHYHYPYCIPLDCIANTVLHVLRRLYYHPQQR